MCSGGVGGYAGGTSHCIQAGGDGVSRFGDGCAGFEDFEGYVDEYSGLSGPATSVQHFHTAEEGMAVRGRVGLGADNAVQGWFSTKLRSRSCDVGWWESWVVGRLMCVREGG